MKKALVLGAATLLSVLTATPPAFAYYYSDNYRASDNYRETRNDWRWSETRSPSERIRHLRAKLDRDLSERRKAEWAYNQARARRDWPTIRFQQARLDRLNREIQRNRYALNRAYEQARRDRYRYEVQRDSYNYRYY